MIRRNRDNKIKIPWYSRRVRQRQAELELFPDQDSSWRIPIRPRPQPVTVRQPSTQPATQPATEPVRVPVLEPTPVPEPAPFPDPTPFPGLPGLPIPGRQPQQEPGIIRPPFREPQPIPQYPALFPIFQPDYDWEAHFQRVGEQTEQLKPVLPEPEPEPANPVAEGFRRILQPVVYLIVGKAMLDQYVKANITDPVYNAMLEDPVLGLALREAEKAEMDVEGLANYFAQYDWDNMDIDQMTKDLTALLGAAGAARIIIFFIGRKVVFRI